MEPFIALVSVQLFVWLHHILHVEMTWWLRHTSISQLRSQGCPEFFVNLISYFGRRELFKVWNWCLYLPQLNSPRPPDRETPLRCQGLGIIIWQAGTKKNVPKFLNDLQIYKKKIERERDATLVETIILFTWL